MESILNQTYDHFELIILDDASTDNSKEVLGNVSDSRLSHCIISQQNSGGRVFLQWQKGLEIAKGELIWIAESDDFCDPAFLEVLVPFFENPEVTLAYCWSRYVDSEGQDLPSPEIPEQPVINEGESFVVSNLSRTNGLYNASMIVFRKSVIPFIDFDSVISKRLCGDWMFWIQVCERGRVAYVNKALNNYRKHLGNVTGAMTKAGVDIIEGAQIIQYLIKRKYIPFLSKMELVNFYLTRLVSSQALSYSRKRKVSYQLIIAFPLTLILIFRLIVKRICLTPRQ